MNNMSPETPGLSKVKRPSFEHIKNEKLSVKMTFLRKKL